MFSLGTRPTLHKAETTSKPPADKKLFDNFSFRHQPETEYKSQTPVVHFFGKFQCLQNTRLDRPDMVASEILIRIAFGFLNRRLPGKFQYLGLFQFFQRPVNGRLVILVGQKGGDLPSSFWHSRSRVTMGHRAQPAVSFSIELSPSFRPLGLFLY